MPRKRGEPSGGVFLVVPSQLMARLRGLCMARNLASATVTAEALAEMIQDPTAPLLTHAGNDERFNVSMSAALAKGLKAYAKKRGRSRSDVIRTAIVMACERMEQETVHA